MSDRNASPRISSIAWGKMEVEGCPAGKDMKLWPGGGRPWDWRETDTRHVPGIQIADAQELLDHGASVIVLSRGMQLLLQTCPELIEHLARQKVAYHIAETHEAVRIYNDLVQKGAPVGGLFHSTC